MAETPIIFRNHDQQLVGMIHTPDRSEPSPAVLMLHGFTGNRMEAHFLFVKMARRLAAAGYAAMRFDFRGSGESQGNFWEMTVPGEVDDARAALDWLRRHPAVDPDRVVLLGLSMGGAVAAAVAGIDPNVAGLILWSAVADLSGLTRHVAPPADDTPQVLGPLPDGRFDLGGLLLGPAFRDTLPQVQPLESVQHYAGPALIIHGTNDEAVPPDHADRYLQAMGEKRALLHWVPGGDHVYSAHVWEEETFGVTLDWLRGVVSTIL